MLSSLRYRGSRLLARTYASEASSSQPTNSRPTQTDDDALPDPIMSAYLEPARHKRRHGIPSAQLHLRSYEIPRLTFFADFAMRAAWHLDLVARGPVPLPKKTERWTVPRGPFVHKKTQENFERVTYKRVIKVEDAHPKAVERWLSYLQANAMPGVGMKVNSYSFESLGVGERIRDRATQAAISPTEEVDIEESAAHMANAAEQLNPAAREAKKLLGEKAYQELAAAKGQIEQAPDTTESRQQVPVRQADDPQPDAEQKKQANDRAAEN